MNACAAYVSIAAQWKGRKRSREEGNQHGRKGEAKTDENAGIRP